MHTVTVGPLEEFQQRIGRVVQLFDREIAIFRTSDEQVYAVDNRNPHPKGGPLAEAIVSGHFIYDPLYDWKIDLVSGEVQAPDHGQVRTYPVQLLHGQVVLSIPQ
ncbi:nitrite reductase small subunit NirD [Paenibacillus sp. P96]|uniref:Nitrite reductase small subunit NirD n=1 Tax=Paenibacillus zeirhizosphaerae TaxID=2987519 RepID=A0ABT9FPW5_9BACL|nr:nitrite reductase small subunit NirD [Paenibacillus sp. P96]MDP4096779.1 nitrite reductase small subunit NirD [Paenibacillus sp. P96]